MKFLTEKIVIDFLKKRGNKILKEISTGTVTISGQKGMVDDGPGIFHPNLISYIQSSNDAANRLGFEVADYLVDTDGLNVSPELVPATDVSYFQKGKELERDETINLEKWKADVDYIANRLGQDVVDYLVDNQEVNDINNLIDEDEDYISEDDLDFISNFVKKSVEEIDEEAVSKDQQQFFGIVKSVKQGDTPESEVTQNVIDVVDKMTDDEIDDFASTNTKGLPQKKKAKK